MKVYSEWQQITTYSSLVLTATGDAATRNFGGQSQARLEDSSDVRQKSNAQGFDRARKGKGSYRIPMSHLLLMVWLG